VYPLYLRRHNKEKQYRRPQSGADSRKISIVANNDGGHDDKEAVQPGIIAAICNLVPRRGGGMKEEGWGRGGRAREIMNYEL